MTVKRQLAQILFSFGFLILTHLALAQNKVITGTITDKTDGSPLLNVSILATGTSKGGLTDSNGNFSISIPDSVRSLKISRVNYVSQDVDIRQFKHVQISLVAVYSSLNDVVVIGYGSVRKIDLTGAVGSVVDKNFNQGLYASPDMLIQGKVSGVQITADNGSPGGRTTIKIRGNSALSGTGQPLYVVDGVPLDGRSVQAGSNPLNFLNPLDIASIDVLKDASASAIYGSRAAYGVVIINTKKGQMGPPRLEGVASIGVSSILKNIRVLNSSEYRQAIPYYGVDPSFDKGANADGMEAITQKGLQQNYLIAGSGGNENGNYRYSLGYLDQEGIVINTGFKKYSADVTTNLKYLNSKRLGLDFHLNASQYIQNGTFLTTGNDGIIYNALTWNPTDSLTNPDGTPKYKPGSNVNPLLQSQYIRDYLKTTTILGSVAPYFKFNDWLEYKLLVSVNYSAGNSRFSVNQVLAEDYGPFIFPQNGFAKIGNTEFTTTQLTQTLSLNKDIARDLHLNAFLGYEYMKFVNQGFGENGNGPDSIGFGNYGLDYTNYIQYSNATTRSISSYIDPDYELQSFFGRAILNYNDRYLLTATFRADGSSKFGANNKYGYFPSFALAWIISRENFFHVDWVNALKLRAGWGETGNQEFPPGSAQALYAFGNSGNIVQVNSPNPNLQWQTDRQWDIGLDFSLLSGRISGTFDYYYKTTTHLLFPSMPIQPAPSGSTVRWINLDGEIVNQGFEMAINGAVVKTRDFSWDLSINASFLNNNVSGLTAPIVTGFVSGPVQIIQNGHPMDAFYTRKFLGLNKSTGFSDYEDNGNTSYFVGNPNPSTLLGFGSNFRYKKFFLVTNWYGSFGQDLYNATLMSALNVTGIQGGNMALSVYQSPIKESLANPAQSPSSRYVQKGDYLRMSNLTLSYNIGNIGNSFKGFNVYITAQNLILITSYPGFDPEVNKDANINGVPSLGIDNSRYPTAKTFLLGINFSL